jgi:CheY-like chemotaxis protein
MEMCMPRRVLVVEDDLDIREVVADYLQGDGFDVAVASNGARALHLARELVPDVAVVDVFMPVMDGRALLATWMQDPILQPVPIILVSAAPGLASLGRQYHVHATLAKPFDLDLLESVIDELLTETDRPTER